MSLESQFKNILKELETDIGFQCDKESQDNTPYRLARMYKNELLKGYSENPKEILSKVFLSKSSDMVIVKNIPFVSLCSHHWLPFIGYADVGYIPEKIWEIKENSELSKGEQYKVVGLSKIPRLVQCFARRFQIQENMTSEIADSLFNILKPSGCIVVCEAEHLCAQIRGAQSVGTKMMTSAVRGCFDDTEIRNEFLHLTGRK